MLCPPWRRRGGGATTEVIQAFLPNRFTDSNTKQSLDPHRSRRGSGLHCSGEGGQRGFLEERLLKLGFEDRSSAEKGIQEVGRNAGHVPGPMICSVWPEYRECIRRQQQIRGGSQEEPGLAGSLNQTWSLPVLQLLHLSTDFPCCPKAKWQKMKKQSP